MALKKKKAPDAISLTVPVEGKARSSKGRQLTDHVVDKKNRLL